MSLTFSCLFTNVCRFVIGSFFSFPPAMVKKKRCWTVWWKNKKDAKMQYEDNYLWISCTYVSIYFLSWQVTWCRSSTASGLRRIPATSWSSTESAPSSTEGSCDSWRTQTWLCAPTSLPPISTLSTSKHPLGPVSPPPSPSLSLSYPYRGLPSS